MLRHALERQDHAVLEARDQSEAVRLLQQAQPAVVLSDLRLPEGDGFGVLRAAKEIDSDIPVIVMTALELTPGERARLLGQVRQVIAKGASFNVDIAAAVSAAVRRRPARPTVKAGA